MAALPFEALLNLIPDCVVLVDPAGTIQFVNAAIQQLLGWSRLELVGRPVEVLLPEKLRAGHVPLREQYVRAPVTRRMGEGRELKALHKDGREVRGDLSLVPLCGPEGGLVMAIFRDLTTLDAARQRLLLQGIALASTANAVIITDVQGKISWVNDAFAKMTGYSREEVVGSTPRFLKSGLHPAEFYRGLWTTVLAGGVWQGEVTNRRKDGSLYVEEQTIAPVRDEGGQITHFVAVKLDITDRRHAEVELRQAKEEAEAATRAKSDFLANMSHEIRTPMNAVIGTAELLADTPLAPHQADLVATVRQSGEMLLALLNDVLDFSKLEARKVELAHHPFDPAAVAEDCVLSLASRAAQRGLELACFVSQVVPAQVVGDPTRFSQIILNLVGNAVKFTEKGSVVVRLEADDLAPSNGAGRWSGCVSVADTGIGIPPQRRSSLFQAFTQVDSGLARRFGGTGLGLVISLGLAEMMGGTIEAESEGVPGKGSVFRFTFGVDLPGSESATVGADAVALRGRRVLVLAGPGVAGNLLCELLAGWGLEVQRRGAVADAVAAMAAGARCDAALFLLLAGRAPAWEEVVRLQEGWLGSGGTSPIPLAVLVPLDAQGMDAMGEEALQASGVVAVLTLPMRVARLKSTLLDLLADGACLRPKPLTETRSLVRAAKEGKDLESLKILVVEDNLVNQGLAVQFLKKLGCEACVAGDGFRALELLAQREFDVVLMDVQMPGMDGLEATRRLRTREAATPQGSRRYVIGLTANIQPQDRRDCQAAGMDDYLSKPLRLRELMAALQRSRVAQPASASPLSLPSPVSTAPDAGPELDPTAFREVLDSMDNPAAIGDIIEAFLQTAPQLLVEMERGLALGDPREVRRAAHTLKSTAAALGATGLAEICGGMEAAARGGRIEDLPQALARAREAYGALQAKLPAMARAISSSDPPPSTVRVVVAGAGEAAARTEGPPVSPTLLVVDDSDVERRLALSLLHRAGYTNVQVAESGPKALALLGLEPDDFTIPLPHEVDLILLDVTMPRMDGVETCRRIRRAGLIDAPVLMITGSTDPGDLAAAYDAGALEYVVKPLRFEGLSARVRAALRLKAETDRRKARERELEGLTRRLAAANAKLEDLSLRDGLTGVGNRRRFDRTFDLEWKRAVREGSSLAIVLADVDFFKSYNDTHGHLMGDDCLRAIANVLETAARRPGDLAARYGGEEFALILPMTDARGGLHLAESVREGVEALRLPHAASSAAGHVTISLGVAAIIPQKGDLPPALLGHADQALYRAKAAGRNRVQGGDEEGTPEPSPRSAGE